MIQIRRAAIAVPMLVVLALPAAVSAALPGQSVTAFPMAAGAAPFGVTAGPRGEWVSLNTRIGLFDHQNHLTTYPIPTPIRSRAG